jgi:hypothetical protein
MREQEEANAGAFAMVDAQSGWLVFSTDLLLSSHLHAFTLTGGMNPEPDGAQPFAATTGAPRASPTPLDGLPSELLAPEVGIAVPAWAIAAKS